MVSTIDILLHEGRSLLELYVFIARKYNENLKLQIEDHKTVVIDQINASMTTICFEFVQLLT